MLLVRLIRSLFAFGVILSSYLVQLALVRLFGRRVRGDDGFVERVVPPWLRERRRRVDRRNARRLLRTMLRLRGVFIKLGQILSIMGGFLPRVYGRELEQLQDQVPPRPFSELEAALRGSFGKGPGEIFKTIAAEPIAAASLGQVHVAELFDGRRVAVKFLYPNIRGMIRVDMKVLALAIRVYRRFVPVARIERVHEQLVDLLGRETDYLHEAECMRRMAKNFAGDPGLAFPEPIAELTTRDVLTMTFMAGHKITRKELYEAEGVAAGEVAVRLVQAFYKMLFADRFFHADPHPGNFLVEVVHGGAASGPTPQAPAGPCGDGKFRLVVLDFGAVCVAKPTLIDGMMEILQGVFTKDDALVVKGFRHMGFVAEGANEALLERTVLAYFSKLLKIRDRTPAALMRSKPEELEKLVDPEVERGELQDLMRSVEYPEEWFYIERACVLMFWLAAQLDPGLDTIAVGLPYLMPLIAERAMANAAAGG